MQGDERGCDDSDGGGPSGRMRSRHLDECDRQASDREDASDDAPHALTKVAVDRLDDREHDWIGYRIATPHGAIGRASPSPVEAHERDGLSVLWSSGPLGPRVGEAPYAGQADGDQTGEAAVVIRPHHKE